MQTQTASSVLSFFTHLKLAILYCHSAINDNKKSVFSIVFKLLLPKLEWCYNTTITHHLLVQHVPQTIEVIKETWNSDTLLTLSIYQKIALLGEKKQEALEAVVDCMLTGESFEVVDRQPHLPQTNVSGSLLSDEEIREAADVWVFETNGTKWSNNDGTAGDNYGSFMAGAKWAASRLLNTKS